METLNLRENISIKNYFMSVMKDDHPRRPIQVALIAAGRIGIMHAEHLLKLPQVRLKVIMDKYRRGKVILKNHPTIQQTDQIDKIWNDPDLDAVVIAASSSAHVPLIKQAVKAGKHIFCEKPISFNAQELFHLSRLVEKNQLFFQVGFNRRFDPHFSRVREVVGQGDIGKLYLIKIINRDPKRPPYDFIPKSGGLFFDFNTHDFDMIHYVSREDIVEVYAMGANLIDPKIGEMGDIDTALINLKLASGAMVSIDCSRETGYGYDQELEAFGSKGSVKALNEREDTLMISRSSGIQLAKPKADFMTRFHEAYRIQMESFIDRLGSFLAREKIQPVVTGWDATRSVAVAEAVSTSYKTGKSQKVIYPSDDLS